MVYESERLEQGNGTIKRLVHTEQVAYRYLGRGGLRAVSLSVYAGEPVLLAGPSGCGKSTLARCLTGLIPHLYRGNLSGRVWVDGLDTRKAPLWRLSERVGLVFQNPAAQMLTSSVEHEIVFGLENLGLAPQAVSERLEAALAQFDLVSLRDRAPQTLSGGEQQKLALAAVTARRPPVLVLDEPLARRHPGAAAPLFATRPDFGRPALCRPPPSRSDLTRSDLTQVGPTRVGCDRPAAVVICEHRVEPLRRVPRLRTVSLEGYDGDASRVAPASTVLMSRFPVAPQSAFRLEVSGLGVDLGRPVLREFGFSARGGQVLAVVGRNGVGKTTLLRALAGLQKHSGRVTIHREGGEPEEERPQLGMVFQNPDLQLFNPTVRQEILYRVPHGAGPDPDMARYAWLVHALGLDRYQETSPLLLSEGEKKRVALATVLMRDHVHGILLDEPTLGQDGFHRAMLVRLARALAEAGQLVVLATHDLALAAQADRLMLLGTGSNGSARIAADGPPARVLGDRAAWSAAGLLAPEWLPDLCAPATGAALGRQAVEHRVAASV